MKKQILSFLLCAVMILGTFSCLPQTVFVTADAATTSQINIAKRAESYYRCKWTSQKSISSWKSGSTFVKGNTYRMPYGQPVTSGKYIGYGVSAMDFMRSTLDESSVFYKSKSYYSGNSGSYAPFYATDCSAFVSHCWGVTRHTTASIPDISSNKGSVTTANVQKIKIGDALNSNSAGHVVLVTDVVYDGDAISKIEITEQTPPQLKRTKHTPASLVASYSAYTIQRYTGDVEAPTFTVTYDPNGGTGSMEDQVVVLGEAANLKANTYTRAGYLFKGWNAYRTLDKTWFYRDADGTGGWYKKGEQPDGYNLELYSDCQSISKTGFGIDDTVTFSAVWEIANGEDGTFILCYDSDGGEGTMGVQVVTYGVKTQLLPNLYTKKGCTFQGWKAYRVSDQTYRYTNGTTTAWYKEGQQPAGYYIAPYKDQATVHQVGFGTGDVVMMTAIWGASNYTVTYLPNGGTGTMEDSQHVYGVQKALSANKFTRSGYTFAGWYLYRPDSGMKSYSVKDKSTNAAWFKPGEQPAGYRLSLYADGRVVSKLSPNEGEVVQCIAQWTPNSTGTQSFYFEFEGNGGEGTMDRQKIIYGTDTNISENQFTYKNHTFLGWYAQRRSDNKWRVQNSDGSTGWLASADITEETTLFLYPDKEQVFRTSSSDCDIVTLYAVWDFVEYFTFTFDPNGGTGVMPDQKVIYGASTSIRKNTFTREGYAFQGWHAYRVEDNEWCYTNGEKKGFYVAGMQPEDYTERYLYADGASAPKAGNGTGDTVKLSAIWEPLQYTIRFDSNGGEGAMSDVEMMMDDYYIVKNDFTRNNTRFRGFMAQRSDGAYYCVNKGNRADRKWLVEDKITSLYEKYVFVNGEKVTGLANKNDEVISFIAFWWLFGDADCSGAVNIKDATAIQRIVAGITAPNIEGSDYGDVDGDNKITIRDATYIQLYVAKKIKYFPAEG